MGAKYAMSGMTMLDVLIASPGDAKPARAVIEKAIHEWNSRRADMTLITLRPRLWEIASVPLLGEGDAQSVINSQIVDGSDIVFAIFYHRLGSPTSRSVSGTVEEIDRSVNAKTPVHLYFAQKSLPYDADLDQFSALREFRSQMQKTGLISTFKTEAELRVQVDRAIELDVGEFIKMRDLYRETEQQPSWGTQTPNS